MIDPAWTLLVRDVTLGMRAIGETLTGLVFFALALSLFPLGIGASPELLSRIGAGVIWVLALLSALISLDGLFQSDFEDGSLEQLMFSTAPLEVLVIAKCLAHWLISGVMLALVSPLMALLMGLPAAAYWAIPASLLIGSPCLTLIGAIGASLLLGSRKTGALQALIVLPLYIPVLIFGVSAADGYIMGLGGTDQLLILAAMTLAAIALAPFAIAAAIKTAVG